MDHSIVQIARRKGWVLAPRVPDWPTPYQMGLFGRWGDPVLANLGGTSAYMFWDWPTEALKATRDWPEPLPVHGPV